MFIEIKDIHKSYGTQANRTEVLKGISAEIEKGEICVLLGPSGSGKSTLLNIIGGIDWADEGYISIDGEKTVDMNEKKLTVYRRNHLGYIFQMYNLIPNLNIKENIEVGAYLSDRALDVDELLHTLGLYEHGMKQIFAFLFIDYSGWIPFYVAPTVFLKMFGLGIMSYIIVAMLQFQKIKKIPMNDALKNVE